MYCMYVCALLIISPGNLIDINPFCEMTYSLLFSWEELRKWECFHKGECPSEKEGVSTEPEIRVIDSVGTIGPSDLQSSQFLKVS